MPFLAADSANNEFLFALSNIKIIENRNPNLGFPELKALEHIYKLLDPPKNQKEPS